MEVDLSSVHFSSIDDKNSYEWKDFRQDDTAMFFQKTGWKVVSWGDLSSLLGRHYVKYIKNKEEDVVIGGLTLMRRPIELTKLDIIKTAQLAFDQVKQSKKYFSDVYECTNKDFPHELIEHLCQMFGAKKYIEISSIDLSDKDFCAFVDGGLVEPCFSDEDERIIGFSERTLVGRLTITGKAAMMKHVEMWVVPELSDADRIAIIRNMRG